MRGYVEMREVVGEDGTVDFAGTAVAIYPRAQGLEEVYEMGIPELRVTANHCEFCPAMRAAHPQWFAEGMR